MIQRVFTELVHRRLSLYPAVTLLGPRQCGKTTLAQSLGGLYYDLEQDSERLRLDLEWARIVAGDQLIILDEAQFWPEVFARLRGAIDQARKRTGRFLILGSVSPTLSRQVAESLTGRLSLVDLTPFLVCEIESEMQVDSDLHWLCGGYPEGGVLDFDRFPQWQKDYLALLVQRDLPNWGLPAKPQLTERLLRMIGAVHGQIWNSSQIAKSLGLSYHTVNTYLGYLEGAYLIRTLRPYQANLKKRLVKSPKVYWRDSGLLHSLLNVPDVNSLLSQPWVGASFEGYVIEQILGALAGMGADFQPWYFRTSDGVEIDLVLDFGSQKWAIEVKLSASPGPGDLRKLQRASEFVGASHQFLISRTRQIASDKNRVSCNLTWMIQSLSKFLPKSD